MDFLGIEKFSLVDYDEKVCVTLFSGGCNFRCPFCHNSSLVLEPKNIKGIPFEEILTYLKSRAGLVDAVTITGGEPTLMRDLVDKIKQIKQLGYLVKLDTNGTNPQLVSFLIEQHLIDYVAMDVKNCLRLYGKTCGYDNVDVDNIIQSIHLLINSSIDYEFRTTLVAEFHDAIAINEMGELIKGAKKVFLQKFVDSDQCIKKGLHSVTNEKARQFQRILSNYVASVELRGY